MKIKKTLTVVSLIAVVAIMILTTGAQGAPREDVVVDELDLSPTDPDVRSRDIYSCNDENYCAAVASMDCTLNGGRANVGHVYWEPGVCMWVCNDGHSHVQVCQSF